MGGNVKRITLEYKPESGEIYDLNGVYLGTIGIGMSIPIDVEREDRDSASKSTVNELAQLKGAGFTADEVMQMRREGLF